MVLILWIPTACVIGQLGGMSYSHVTDWSSVADFTDYSSRIESLQDFSTSPAQHPERQ